MICLDTNYLILGLVAGSTEADHLVAWGEDGQRFCVPSIAWYEFLCGPVGSTQVATMRALAQSILPFGPEQAREAARLFNAAGRTRRLRVDAMIAACATTHSVPLATSNAQDFAAFVPLGLRLVACL